MSRVRRDISRLLRNLLRTMLSTSFLGAFNIFLLLLNLFGVERD